MFGEKKKLGLSFSTILVVVVIAPLLLSYSFKLSRFVLTRFFLRNEAMAIWTAGILESESWWDVYRASLARYASLIEKWLERGRRPTLWPSMLLRPASLGTLLPIAVGYSTILLCIHWIAFGETPRFGPVPIFQPFGTISWLSWLWRSAIIIGALAAPMLLWSVSNRYGWRTRNGLAVGVACVSLACVAAATRYSESASVVLFFVSTSLILSAIFGQPLWRTALISMPSTLVFAYLLDTTANFFFHCQLDIERSSFVQLVDLPTDFESEGNDRRLVDLLRPIPKFFILCAGLYAIAFFSGLVAMRNYLFGLGIAVVLSVVILTGTCEVTSSRKGDLNAYFGIGYVLLVVPIANAAMDWISLGVTRVCLRNASKSRGSHPLPWILIDVGVAVALFFIFAAIVLCFSAVLEWMVGISTGRSLGLDLTASGWIGALLQPSNAWMVMSRLTVFLPTLVYMSMLIGCFCLSVIGKLTGTATIAQKIREQPGNVFSMVTMELLLTAYLTAAIFLTLVFIITVIALLT